jgi:DNA-binding PadR family transcriptional regulator
MTTTAPLGEVELLILAATHRLGDEAYGSTIRQEIAQRTDRDVSIGSLYAALGRLGDKGLVRFDVSDPRPVQGGRARKSVRLTPLGVRALRDTSASLARMFEGLVFGAKA